MKKLVLSFIFILALLLLTVGCSKWGDTPKSTPTDKAISTGKSTSIDTNSSTPSTAPDETSIDDTQDQPVTSPNEFRSEKFGFSIVFLENWYDKYAIVEKEKGISVYFKPRKATEEVTGLFFTIIQKSDDLDESWYDTVGDTKYFTAKGITYFIGGPTDVNFPPDHPEFNTFLSMNQERAEVLKTLRSLDE